MGVELRLSHKGKNICRLRVFESRLLRIFGPMREGEDCIMRSFITWMFHQILVER